VVLRDLQGGVQLQLVFRFNACLLGTPVWFKVQAAPGMGGGGCATAAGACDQLVLQLASHIVWRGTLCGLGERGPLASEPRCRAKQMHVLMTHLSAVNYAVTHTAAAA
jgi:hypothetical protein